MLQLRVHSIEFINDFQAVGALGAAVEARSYKVQFEIVQGHRTGLGGLPPNLSMTCIMTNDPVQKHWQLQGWPSGKVKLRPPKLSPYRLIAAPKQDIESSCCFPLSGNTERMVAFWSMLKRTLTQLSLLVGLIASVAALTPFVEQLSKTKSARSALI
jgi:hypothetical protein